MQGFSRRALALPLAIAIVAAGAVIFLWNELRRDHETRIADVVEATSYATRSDLARRLTVQFLSLGALADFWIAAADAGRVPDSEAPLDFANLQGVEVVAWNADDGTRFIATRANPTSKVPSADEWARLAPWIAEAFQGSDLPTSPGPYLDDTGHATFRYYVPVRNALRRGVLVAVIDAEELLGALLTDEAPGYDLRVSCCEGVPLYARGESEGRIPASWSRDGWIAPVPGIRWNVAHRPSDQLAATLNVSPADSLLIVGLALALLLGGLVFETRRANERAAAANDAEQRVRKLHRELEERVVARTQQLHDVLRDLNTINLSVSHDLRSPLNTISLTVGQLDATNRDEGTGRLLARITASVDRMATMMDRLLGYTRASSFESALEEIDMRELTELAVREQGLDPRAVSIGSLPNARADRVITHILISNLLANAARHGRGGRPLKIEVGSAPTDSGVPAYFVRDFGPGIEPKVAEQLFRPLPDRARRPGESGLGLGLAIAARAVERHGGKIWVESEPGRGATFWFTLAPPPESDEDGD
jgi:signal transduction histidine kinase